VSGDDFTLTPGTVGAELTWAHIFKALGIEQGEFPPHPLHVKAMADMLGPQVACADCWERRDDCGKHETVLGNANQQAKGD